MKPLNVNSFWRDIFTFRKESSNYRRSRRDFYEGKNYLSHHERIKTIIQSTSSRLLNIEKPIKFYGLEFGSTYKEAIRHLGKPNYVTQGKMPVKDLKSIFYRLNVSGVKCILQLHFLEKKFFLGVIEISNSIVGQENEISNLVRDKYEIADYNWLGLIQDEGANTIELCEGMIKRIIYTSGDPSFKEKLKEQLDKFKNKRQKHEHHRNKLILDMI
jgi:hypothetical protein